MKTSILALLAILAPFTLCGSAAWASDAPTAPAPLRERCMSLAPVASSSALQIALTNLSSFQYVLHASEAMRGEVADPVYCVSGIALSRNIYQYVEYLVQVDVRDAADLRLRRSFRFVFQDASVQAYHNVQGQPWIGVSAAEVDERLGVLDRGAEFKPLAQAGGAPAVGDENDPLAIARATPPYTRTGTAVDPSTISIIRLPSAGAPIYLVSWLTRPSDNPYLDVPRLSGVLVSPRADDGPSAGAPPRWAETPALTTALRFPLEQLRDEHARSNPDRAGWTEMLLRLSQP